MFKTDKYEENENNIFFLTPKIEIKMNLKEIIFFNRHKKAKELASSKNFKSIVDFDNVTEAFIYEYLLINKKNLDFTKLENKTLISGLTKKNFESLKINVDYYFDYKNVFFKFIDLLNNDLIAATTFDKNNLLDLYVNDEMLLNQPLSFMNNSNLMYYSMLNYLIPSPNISLIEKYDYLLQKQSTVRILLKNIYNIESLSEDEVWTVVFYIISIGDSHVVSDFKEKLIKKKKEISFSIINLEKNLKCKINDNILYGYNYYKEEVIKIPSIDIFDIELIKKLLSQTIIKYNNINDIYNSIDLLKCIRIEFLNKHNYYTPHLHILKKIIKKILTSKAIDEFIDNFLDHSSSLNPFKNEEYYNLLWDKYIHFVIFQKEDFYAEVFRIYHKVFFNALPFFNIVSIEKNLIRLFNYSIFIIIALHELLGHLEKVVLYYFNKNIRVKTEELLEIEFEDIFSDNLEEEIDFLQKELKKEYKIRDQKNKFNKPDISIDKKSKVFELLSLLYNSFDGPDKVIKEELNVIITEYIKTLSDEYLNTLKEKILFYTENFKNNNKILEALNKMLKIVKILLDANEENLSHSKEGGFIVENILFGSEIFSDLKELSINQVLFILNSNNYSSIQNLRKVSSMYISYRYAKKKGNDYINPNNYSEELKHILFELGITETLLENQDRILISEMFSEYLINNNRNKKLKKKQNKKLKSCIPPISFSKDS